MDRVLVDKQAAAVAPVEAARLSVPRLVAWAALTGAGLTGLAVVAMMLRRLPTGSREAGWTDRYHRLAGQWHVLWPALVVAPAVLGLLRLSLSLPERADAAVVAGWFVAVIPLQLLLRAYALPSLGDIVASDRANSFYSPSQRWGIGEFMGN